MKNRHNAPSQLALESPLVSVVKSLNNPVSMFPMFPPDSLLNQVFRFIETNYNQPISLSDVAIAVGYCAAYLTNLVRCNTGHTVNDWIAERRMVAARALLLETDQCMNQIAEAIGYQYVSHFFRQFRQYHGTTPQNWRKAQRSYIHSNS